MQSVSAYKLAYRLRVASDGCLSTAVYVLVSKAIRRWPQAEVLRPIDPMIISERQATNQNAAISGRAVDGAIGEDVNAAGDLDEFRDHPIAEITESSRRPSGALRSA